MTKKRSLLSRLKRKTFDAALGAVRLLPGSAPERMMHRRLVDKNGKKPEALMRVAWAAEESNDLMLAVMAWHKLAKLELSNDSNGKEFLKALRKFVVLETMLRKRVLASGKVTSDMIWADGPDLPIEPDPRLKNQLKSSALKSRAGFLRKLWQEEMGTLSEKHQASLCRAYAQQVTPLLKDGNFAYAMIALQPLLMQWPTYPTGQRFYHRIQVEKMLGSDPQGFDGIEGWWAYYHAHPEYFDEKTTDQVFTQTVRVGREMMAEKRANEAEQLIMPAFQEWPDRTSALSILAEVSELNNDWRASADRWQLLAAVSNPVTTKSRTHVAQNVEEMKRRTKHAGNQLRHARIKLAGELYEQGKRREFAELTNRIVETIPDQRVLKNDREIVDLVQKYVSDALREDGATQGLKRPADNKPLRIAICLDVLKISDVHTHARVVYAMCRNLMEMNDQIETHIIVTNERFAVTTPIVASSFNPVREETMIDGAREALPEFFGSRFFMHVFRNSGLEGLIETSKSIIDIGPDVILYGGGHRGLFSNESRVIRHCLYDLFPTAFFYIQANNQVDDKLDMVIARGPHEIDGELGQAKVRVQPYPTIVEQGFVNEVPIDLEKHARKHVVSAITGVRMDVRMKEIDPAEMGTMMSLLDLVPGTVWHLIGATDPEKVIASNPVIKSRVEAGQVVVHPVLPFDEFTELVGNSSLFFHIPGFTGGSGGATVARRGGIPIVTFEHSDVSGRQPAETVFASDNLAGAVAKSAELLKDGEAWKRTVEAQFAHTNWIRETAASGFYDCLTETIALSNARLDTKVVRLQSSAERRAQLSVV